MGTLDNRANKNINLSVASMSSMNTYQMEMGSSFAGNLDNNLQYKYGFKTNEVTLHDAFKFQSYSFKHQIPDQFFQQSALQSGHLWIFTQRNKLLIKSNIEDESGPYVVDNHMLKRQTVKKMYVDRKGMHCFLLADHEIYYNNWNNDQVHQIPVNVDGSDQPRAFKSIDIFYLDDNDLNIFEVLLGTEDG
eukprot:CAMPEP_0116872960 /NCGR_PEP_ID=MMETSP0463-20121206/3906_1 /TAXON_ID=181622 /ORGANISM="Strombidinopsis sp, Strain SopsisLIS2011" /LENGTH=189 /DNA_ID=CAMNT_0004514095 /DNA_START=90 /DNA_END=659 /DNA_ORIENTATION=+